MGIALERGLGETRIDDIAERAGITKGTFYHYFSSRLALIEALQARLLNRLAEGIQANMGASAPAPQAQLSAWTRGMITGCLMEASLQSDIFRALPARHRGSSGNESIALLEKVLRDGTELGCWITADPQLTATFAFHGLHRKLIEEFSDIEGELRHSAQEFVRRLVCNGELAEPGSAAAKLSCACLSPGPPVPPPAARSARGRARR